MVESNETASKSPAVTASKRPDRNNSSIMDLRREDFVGEALQKAVDAAVEFKKLPGLIASQMSSILNSLAKSSYPESPEEKGGRRYPHIEQSIAQRDLDMEDAQFVYGGAELDALTAFETQQKVWSRAVKQYNFGLATGEIALRTAVKAAVDHYKDRTNPDSERHNSFLYYTMRSAVAAALTDYERLAGTAAGTLAAAAGEVLTAYATFASSVSVAQSTLLSSEATAELTFWESVEQVRDG